jgi:hydrogenase/urease accessory protein HupE
MSDAGHRAGPLARFMVFLALVGGLFLFVAKLGCAHEVRPAYLELKEEAPGFFDVLFKTPMLGDLRLALSVGFSGRVEAVIPILSRVTDNAVVQTWRVRTTDSILGQQVRVIGLENTVTDALLRVEFIDGRSWVQRLTPGSPQATIPVAPSASNVAATYLWLGIEHILLGYDHLLFVFGLLLIAANTRQLVKAITAFTVAHSITLAAAVLGVVHVPPAPIEAAIALSIVIVALEIVHARRGRAGLAARSPWLAAFAFGLLHGFGFAGALSEIGMPEGRIPVALLFFNLGVEAGQLLFVAVVMALAALVRRIQLPRWAMLVPPYVIGSLAMFWVLQRVAAF